MFSGQPNPSWVIDDTEAKSFLDELSSNRKVISELGKGRQGLGYRGVQIDLLAGHLQDELELPMRFMIADGASKDESKGRKIARSLVGRFADYAERDKSEKDEKKTVFQHPLLETSELQELMVKQIELSPELLGPKLVLRELTVKDCIEEVVAEHACNIELAWYTPGYWNDDAYIKRWNNCYNYATNRRTDTFAQPGKGGGGWPYSDPLNCAVIKAAAIKYDGAHRRCDCFPDSERPRYLMALAVWPGVDYHWYRKHIGGFWGHKPGNTEVRNVDNDGLVIYDPEACNRGPYTEFCGYLYSCKSMKVL
jgi:hypothetical protein